MHAVQACRYSWPAVVRPSKVVTGQWQLLGALRADRLFGIRPQKGSTFTPFITLAYYGHRTVI